MEIEMNKDTLEKLREMKLYGMYNTFKASLENYSRNNMTIEDMVTVRNSGGKYTVKGMTGCNSYLDFNGEPVLILEVNHALGDYVEVQF